MMNSGATNYNGELPYEDVVRDIKISFKSIQEVFEILKFDKNSMQPKEDLVKLLETLSKQLLDYKVVSLDFMINNEMDNLSSECGKDTVRSFNQAIDQLVERIRNLREYISNAYFASSWPQHEINFLRNEIENISAAMHSTLNTVNKVSLCGYYNEIGTLD
ncbi:MAG: hypothetical protein HYV97_14870 [Bdellovibrio sp.]|nr:hypothetical protein [Bdellovibrio sp.]